MGCGCGFVLHCVYSFFERPCGKSLCVRLVKLAHTETILLEKFKAQRIEDFVPEPNTF